MHSVTKLCKSLRAFDMFYALLGNVKICEYTVLPLPDDVTFKKMTGGRKKISSTRPRGQFQDFRVHTLSPNTQFYPVYFNFIQIYPFPCIFIQFYYYPILSSFIQFYPVLFSFIQLYLYPILSSVILILFYLVLSTSSQYYPVSSSFIIIQFYLVLFLSSFMQVYPVLSSCIQFYPV